MEKSVSDAIEEINSEINELKRQITLIESIDFSKPVTEDEWYEICETPLRSSDLLCVIVKNIFPQAENINLCCRYVNFDLLGFEVQISTSGSMGINVNTDWYKRDKGEPILEYSPNTAAMKNYFEAVDNKAGWYECAKHRLRYGKTCKKWWLFIVWWFKYKWKDPHRDYFEQKIKEEEQEYENRVKKYHEERAAIKDKTEKLFNELIPMINQFSTLHFPYNNECWHSCTIEQIKELENI